MFDHDCPNEGCFRLSPSPVQGTRRSHYHTKRHVARQERKIAGGNGPTWREYDVAKLHLSNSRQKKPLITKNQPSSASSKPANLLLISKSTRRSTEAMNSSSLHSPIPSSKSKRPKPDSESTAATPKSKPSSNPTIATQTPTQPSQVPPRLRSRRVALSLKEVRQIASQDLGTSQSKSARRQIASWPEDSTTTTSKLHKPRKNQTRNGLTKIPDK